jgi:hypothetical protein
MSTSGSDTHLTVVQVAARLGKRYHKARDMMLQGRLGKPTIEGRTMTVPLAGVMAWEQKQREDAARAADKAKR